jgi:hypothetical protein
MADWTRHELGKNDPEAKGRILMEQFDHDSGASVMLYMDTRGSLTVYEAHFVPPNGQRVNSISNPLFTEEDPDLLTRKVISWTAGHSQLGLGDEEKDDAAENQVT